MFSSSIDNPIFVRHDKRPLGNAQSRRRVEVVHFPLNLLHPRKHLPAGAKIIPVRNPRRPCYLPPAVGNGLALLIPIPVGPGLDPAFLRRRGLNQRGFGLVHIHVTLDAIDLPRRAVLPDNIVPLVGAGGVVLGDPVLTVRGEGRGSDFVVEPVFGSIEPCAVASIVNGFAELYAAICTNCFGGV